MATARTTTRCPEALDFLAQAISNHRSTALSREAARELARYDNPGHNHLVGIDYAATEAVCFHFREQFTIAVSFDAHGGPRFATLRGETLRAWIDRLAIYWGWLDPRYR